MGNKQKSIITDDLSRCIFCDRPREHIHHVFPGSFRQLSDQYGCIAPLCQEHHTGPHGVHFNKGLDNQLKELTQKAFKEKYGCDIIEVFGRRF